VAGTHNSGAVQLGLPIPARVSPIAGMYGEEAPEVPPERSPTAAMLAKGYQSPTDRYFNPYSPCHSPFAASYGSIVAVGPPPTQDMSSQNCFFAVYPCFEPPQQMIAPFVCPADVAANSVAHGPGIAPCFAAAPLAATEPSMMASSATMPSTPSVITAPTAGVWESGQRYEPPPQPQLPDSEAPLNRPKCPAAVYVDLSCLKEKGHSSAESGVSWARKDRSLGSIGKRR